MNGSGILFPTRHYFRSAVCWSSFILSPNHSRFFLLLKKTMASSSSSFWAHVSRSCSSLRSRTVSTSLSGPVFRRSFVMSALTRSALPRRLYPCDMLLARNASTAAAASHIPEEIYQPVKDEKDPATHFKTMEERLHPDTLKAITRHPFKHTHMSAVQARIFPLLPHLAEAHDAEAAQNTMDRPRDLLVKAKTGTGKTMAFLVPAIESRLKAIQAHVAQVKVDSGLDWSRGQAYNTLKAFATNNVGTLILSPTRELATQIAVEARNLTYHHAGFHVQLLLGGESRAGQIREWKRARKDIVVATPGRLMDLLDTQPEFAEALQATRLLVLDEADTLLDMGFRDDIARISKRLPQSPVRQTFLFSATVSTQIQGIAREVLDRNHTFVNCVSNTDSATHTHIPQYATTLQSGADLFPHLLKLIAHDQLLCKKEGRKSKVIVFFSTTRMTQLFADMLLSATAQRTSILPFQGRNTRTYEMHAKRDMSKRISVSNAFRADSSPDTASVLVTSDVSARGVDYPGVTRVIQIGLPSSVEMYVHRIGRTGRGGDRGGQGRGDLVVMDWEAQWLPKMEKETGGKVNRITTDELAQDCQTLVDELKETTGYDSAHFGEINSFAHELTQRLGDPEYDTGAGSFPGAVASDLMASTFSSQAGFYIGRATVLGLRTDAAIKGLQTFFQTMCGHDRPMNIPRKLLEMYEGRGDGGYKKRGNSFGYTGSGRPDRYSGYDGGSSRGGGGGGYSALSRGGGYSSYNRNDGGYASSGYSAPSRGGEYASSDRKDGGYGNNSYGSSSPREPERFDRFTTRTRDYKKREEAWKGRGHVSSQRNDRNSRFSRSSPSQRDENNW